MQREFTLREIDEVATEIAEKLQHAIVRMDGVMGAGKTTFIKALAREMGVVDAVSSPTFSVVNTYLSASGNHLYHFDFYRIESPAEALDFGVEEYFDSGSVCFLEWSEKIENLLPEEYSTLTIEILDENSRRITLTQD
ncbi:MAG: tRNA (adenosine(37)-N6)-threonylcarbamoyltransferase complex ATPase subunit type 1 TsaE [Flavobacteriaceae bacterium]